MNRSRETDARSKSSELVAPRLRSSPTGGGGRVGRTDGARFLRSQPTGKPKWKIWLLLALVLWAGYTALAGPQGLIRLYQIRGEERALEHEVAHLTAQLDSLRVLGQEVGKDPFLREKVAREVYGMARSDELIYFLKPGSEVPMGPSGPRAEERFGAPGADGDYDSLEGSAPSGEDAGSTP